MARDSNAVSRRSRPSAMGTTDYQMAEEGKRSEENPALLPPRSLEKTAKDRRSHNRESGGLQKGAMAAKTAPRLGQLLLFHCANTGLFSRIPRKVPCARSLCRAVGHLTSESGQALSCVSPR